MAVRTKIDWDAIEKGVIDVGVSALTATSIWLEDRAKYYAPVRTIFGRSRRGSQAVGRLRFRSPDNMATFRRSQPRLREVLDAGGVGRAIGHRNSMQPVFKFGRLRVTGDFRLLDEETGKLAKVEATKARPGREPSYQDQDANFLLSSRGGYEVRSGRATHREDLGERLDTLTGLNQHRFGAPHVGGRLRSEIFRTPVEPRGDGRTYWAYVVSPTPYARFQEFGTAHNRAHPFLRPALYEARAEFKRQIRRAYR